MSRTMLPIDCHVLTMPYDRPEWSEALRADLEREGVTQHWLPGIPGQHAKARAAGFRLGTHEYLTKADPDDRIAGGGVYKALYDALEAHPFAPFAWAGEIPVNDYLAPIDSPNTAVSGYNPRHIIASPMHAHGVVLYRRALVMRVLPKLEAMQGEEGLLSDWLLDLLLAAPQSNRPPDWQPIHIPIIGRFWRQHESQAHALIKPEHYAATRKAAGVTYQPLTITRRPPPPKRPSGDCPTCGT